MVSYPLESHGTSGVHHHFLPPTTTHKIAMWLPHSGQMWITDVKEVSTIEWSQGILRIW